ncbi:exodeoxyribonuclease VIII [Oleiphilus sp. HI0130]|nr:exodeoxyribonuclease VIII [Oleiphilus sp. HI0130]KZZ72465.1 exodeoxyribonuclease VIII [Oleiphilus sp. HI0130]
MEAFELLVEAEEKDIAPAEPGYYLDLPNDAYHSGPGISKSQLDLVSSSPALLQWSKSAPRDKRKEGALNLGDAVHAILLEPHRFNDEFAVAPERAPRNTIAGKEKWAEFEAGLDGQTVITAEEFKTISLIRESVMAHPQARWLIEAEGDAEASIYWKDSVTSLLCRCRPDKLVPEYRSIIDVKTTHDIKKFHWSVRDYRYDVQDAFYSEGYAEHFGELPERFLFLVVSTTSEAGRYPVRLFELDEQSKLAGFQEMRSDLDLVSKCTNENNWPGIELMSVPQRFTKGN